ncbi:MAG TPA: hypothetical protein VK689_09550 [Armatimonadota bacterium]|nr:hypothetical protein [Armatimonadota bacterium]
MPQRKSDAAEPPTAHAQSVRHLGACEWGALVLLPILSVAHILVVARTFGIGLAPDSANYIAAAESFAQGHGLRGYTGDPLTLWPPLYPLLLGLPRLAGVPPVSTSLVLSAACFGLVTLLAGVWIARYVRHFWLALLGQALVATSPSMVLVCRYAFSEPPLVVFTLLFLMIACHRLERGTGGYGILGVLLCMAAATTKYVGVALPLTGALLLLLPVSSPFSRHGTLRQRGWRSGVFLFASVAPLGVWIVRNYLVSGTLAGARSENRYSVAEQLNALLQMLSQSLSPVPGVAKLGFVGMALVLAAAICVGVSSSKAKPPAARVLPPALFCAIYLLLFLVSVRSTNLDLIWKRHLAPLYPPLVYLVLLYADAALGAERLPSARVARWCLLVVALLHLPLWFRSLLRDTRQMAERGIGWYSTPQWRESPLVRHLAGSAPPGRLYSNYPDVVYLTTGRYCRLSPVDYRANRWFRAFSPQDLEPSLMQTRRSGEPSSLVWFDDSFRTYLVPVERLRTQLPLRQEASFPDGAVYSIP